MPVSQHRPLDIVRVINPPNIHPRADTGETPDNKLGLVISAEDDGEGRQEIRCAMISKVANPQHGAAPCHATILPEDASRLRLMSYVEMDEIETHYTPSTKIIPVCTLEMSGAKKVLAAAERCEDLSPANMARIRAAIQWRFPSLSSPKKES